MCLYEVAQTILGVNLSPLCLSNRSRHSRVELDHGHGLGVVIMTAASDQESHLFVRSEPYDYPSWRFNPSTSAAIQKEIH